MTPTIELVRNAKYPDRVTIVVSQIASVQMNYERRAQIYKVVVTANGVVFAERHDTLESAEQRYFEIKRLVEIQEPQQ